MHLQVNYLGHFLLTALLLPLINKSTQGRVVNVSAHSYQSGKIAPDDPLNVDTIEINGEATYHARHAYSHSKLAVLLTTKYWAKRVGSSKSKVTVNCCTPGLVRGTGHFRRWVKGRRGRNSIYQNKGVNYQHHHWTRSLDGLLLGKNHKRSDLVQQLERKSRGPCDDDDDSLMSWEFNCWPRIWTMVMFFRVEYEWLWALHAQRTVPVSLWAWKWAF